MEYAYAVLILNETNAELNETNITGVLEAAGVDVEESRVKALVAALEDVTIADVLPALDTSDFATTETSPPEEPDDHDEADESAASDGAATESDAALVEGGGTQTEPATESTSSETAGGG